MSFRRLAVYCASSEATVATYGASARAVGRDLANAGIGVVYGGGRVGLMGQLAEGALEVGGEVIGVIPERLMDLELGHTGCTELRIVDSMHTRKAVMAELSDGFIALPGGWGTWEELLEVTTWTQLGYHRKPVGVLNVHGYYDPLQAQVARALEEGFVRPEVGHLLAFDTSLEALLATMAAMEIPDIRQWIDAP